MIPTPDELVPPQHITHVRTTDDRRPTTDDRRTYYEPPIEHGVPIPPRRLISSANRHGLPSRLRLSLVRLAPGDSFTVPVGYAGLYGLGLHRKFSGQLSVYMRRHPEVKLTSRILPDGSWRVWRTE